jgi:hypothetical protein
MRLRSPLDRHLLTSNPDPYAEHESADDTLGIGGKVRRAIDEKRNVLIARNSQAQASSQPDDACLGKEIDGDARRRFSP